MAYVLLVAQYKQTWLCSLPLYDLVPAKLVDAVVF